MSLIENEYWYKNAVVYGLDVGIYQDSDNDGHGDFGGLIRRLDYLSWLGIDTIWLMPIYPTPNRDNGYDISDYNGVEPKIGSPGYFVDFVREASRRGIRVILDVVFNHTSTEHVWFRDALARPTSPFRDFFVWSEEKLEMPPSQGPMFPGVQDSVWTWCEEAGKYYFHRFYDFEPSLNNANPNVRAEMYRILRFWLQLGVSGFRVDAANHMVEPKGDPNGKSDHSVLKEMNAITRLKRGDSVLIGEADAPPDEIAEFFDGGNELQGQLNFLLCNYIFLALARESGEPLADVLSKLPDRPISCQWFNFLRNFDELDLERLSENDRAEVLSRFAPEEDMRLYGRGIRRRLAPMLNGDARWMKLAYSILFSLPGAPVIVQGEEIGMSEDLERPERQSVRAPMQWSSAKNAGFSGVEPGDLCVPLICDGPFGFPKVNVEAQRKDPESLLRWIRELVRARKSCPEIGLVNPEVLVGGNGSVLGLRYEHDNRVILAVHNLSRSPASPEVDLPEEREVLLDSSAAGRMVSSSLPEIEGFGTRWFAATKT